MWLKEKGIKINLEKCNFFHMKLNFLDRIITEDGYQIDTSNISRVTSISEIPPSNIHKLRQMLELLCWENIIRILQELPSHYSAS